MKLPFSSPAVGRNSRSILVLFLSASVGLSGCANVVHGALTAARADSERKEMEANRKPEQTQLQIRALQTREYDAERKADILPVALAVLQDDGYVVQNANMELGLLSAHKQLHEKKVDDTGTAFLKGFFGGGMVSSQKFSTIETNITVTPFGDKLRVRLSARLSALSTTGNMQYEQVTEPKFYQEFFTKLEKGLFIEREQI